MRITISEPCKVDGQDKVPGDIVDINENDAMAIVSAGRGTIDPARSEALIADASKAKGKQYSSRTLRHSSPISASQRSLAVSRVTEYLTKPTPEPLA